MDILHLAAPCHNVPVTFTLCLMTVRPFAFTNPVKDELEHVLSVLGDLRRAKQTLGFLHNTPSLFSESGAIAGALYTQALVSYVRCFTSGRRRGIDTEIFSGRADMLAIHKDVKGIRDRHVAHPVGELERWDILVAAEDLDSPAVGLGVHNWFFVGPAPAEVERFMTLIRFVDGLVEARITELGNELAREILGPEATWESAQESFWKHVSRDQVYGATRG